MENRVRKLQECMRQNGVNLVALGPTSNMLYLLGFAPHADERLCVLFIGTESCCIVVPSLNMEEMAAHTAIDLLPWKDADGPQSVLTQVKTKFGLPGVMAVDGAMRADSLLYLMETLGPGRIARADDLVAPLRMIKSEDEIELLAKAAAQADRAMQAAVEASNVGISEKVVAWAAESAFALDGADEVCFTLVASGPNGAFPHHHSGERKLAEGDTIIIDIGASLGGYKSDITRVVHLGEPNAEIIRSYEAVYGANREAIAAVKPGAVAESIDFAARSFLEEAGLGELFVHRTGHGIGLDIHESPWIMAGNRTLLEPGMVFSIEPGVYLPGKFGIRVEDIIAVTDCGSHCLTGFAHSLVIKE